MRSVSWVWFLISGVVKCLESASLHALYLRVAALNHIGTR